MWFATDRGLVRLRDGALSIVGGRQGLPVDAALGQIDAQAFDAVAAMLGDEGRAVRAYLEALDQHDLIARFLPEWEPVRSKPQRNAYHRFTVDRHLWEAAANAAELVTQVSRPDLLVLGALFHVEDRDHRAEDLGEEAHLPATGKPEQRHQGLMLQQILLGR